MSTNANAYETFAAVKTRLDEIVQAVSDENLPLDDALDLYEEAVSLGMRASELLETGIEDGQDAEAQDQVAAAEADGASEGDSPVTDAAQASAED